MQPPAKGFVQGQFFAYHYCLVVSFYFYDLETSGFNPRDARIMQFAGQRTDMELKPVGEPHNFLIKMTDDVVPDPDAVLVTGITPQATLTDGLTEAEFLKIFYEEIATAGTIFVGFNSIRFDDEFMRFLHYRNFYDPYAWQWQDGRSRWDLLDVVRMTRALRPEGIKWPVDSEGKPSNRLELLTSLNKLEHSSAHDALSDVKASIAVARLIRNKQTKLFDYLLGMRDKQKIAELVNANQPFVYSSGKYPAEYEKTTVAMTLGNHPRKQGVLVFDLRHDPADYINLPPEQLVELWRYNPDREAPRLPVKTLQFNRCPAIAPLGVLDKASLDRLHLDLKIIEKHRRKLAGAGKFSGNLLKAIELLNRDQQSSMWSKETEVDGQLYDGFVPDRDKPTMSAIRAAAPDELAGIGEALLDPRLKTLLPLYKARNFPKSLTNEERQTWEAFRTNRLLAGKEKSRLAGYFKRLQELAARPDLSDDKRYLLEELQLYGQSIMPESDESGGF